MEGEFHEIVEFCRPFTMCSTARQYALYQSTIYIEQRRVPGVIVECGVFKGGSMMLSALTLKRRGIDERLFYLYDTFAGMSQPTGADGTESHVTWRKYQKRDYNEWCFASIEEVRGNMLRTDYPQDRVRLIPGKVEDTIPSTIPNQIALLRLDTDWYESTKHELTHLYPRLAPGGVLIIDDYGTWQGAKKAVDEYFADRNVLLTRVDNTGRIGVKPH
jgi:hypothetical protein